MSWIKMRSELRDEHEVIRIAERLGIEEKLVIGNLYVFWVWVDKTTADGRIAGVSLAWVDKYLGVNGFAQAMVEAGWLVVEDDCLVIPNFHFHMGESAKKRDMAAKRAFKSREGKRNSVTQEAQLSHTSCATPSSLLSLNELNSSSSDIGNAPPSTKQEQCHQQEQHPATVPITRTPPGFSQQAPTQWLRMQEVYVKHLPGKVKPKLDHTRRLPFETAVEEHDIEPLVRALEWIASSPHSTAAFIRAKSSPIDYLLDERNTTKIVEQAQDAAMWTDGDPESATASYDPIKALREYREQERKAASGA